MIKINKVNKYFNRFRKNSNHVINNTTLTLEDKGLVALLGPSGSGKTTLLNAIGGLDKINNGSIYINNQKITSKLMGKADKIRNLNIGYIFQDYKLVDNMSVFDNVALSLKTIGLKDKKEITERVTYVLECVGMYRYRKRPASMLSGGQRQRVGIARAIVKNPQIIIADEPTGNLDSKNSLEIMNIIKKISEDRLVILVTHEVNLARFYASRIIEIEDGKVISDKENDHEENLDYTIDNNIYLKDMKVITKYDSSGIDVYQDKEAPINIEIVLKGNNIFIKSKDNKKIEVIDDASSIEFINDHFKTMEKKDLKNIKFNFNEKLVNTKRLRYTSIFNPVTFISNGFKKVLNYSFIKKLLLGGFLASGFFILFSLSRIAATRTIHEEDFIEMNKNYVLVNIGKYTTDDYYRFKAIEGIEYILPGNSIINVSIKVDDYYQTAKNTAMFSGSLSSISMLKEKDIIKGRMPENENEIVIDSMIIDKAKKEYRELNAMGIIKIEDFLDRYITVETMPDFKIVGISDLKSPSIYVDESKFINMIYNSNKGNYDEVTNSEESSSNSLQDYNLHLNHIILKEGRLPENDFEVMLNIKEKESFPLNKEMTKSIDGIKLRVVGYYDSEDNIDYYLVNNNMITRKVINSGKNLVIYAKNKEKVIEELQNNKINAKDSYEQSKNKYLESTKKTTSATVISALVVLVISLIEIVLMLRSSFLSRIKEVGIYRAIGLKKKDIYIMFSGEIIAITTIASVPGVLLSAYIFKTISTITYVSREFLVTPSIVILSIIIVYTFNLLFGLLPVINTLRKRPAQILSRTDI